MGRKADNIKKILVKTTSGEYKEVKNLYYRDGANILPVENAYTKINNGGYSSYLQFWTTDPLPEPDYDFIVSVKMAESPLLYTESNLLLISNEAWVYGAKRSYQIDTIISQKDSLTFELQPYTGLLCTSHGPGHVQNGGQIYVYSDENNTEWWHDGYSTEIIAPNTALIAADEQMVAGVLLLGNETLSDIVGFTITNTTTLDSVTAFSDAVFVPYSNTTYYTTWPEEDRYAIKNLIRTAYLNNQTIGIKARFSYEFNA
jgi:hypothetical protein